MAWQSSKFSNTTSASYWFQALARIQREGEIILTKSSTWELIIYSWQWKGDKDGFNWTNECLKRDFPRARVLLFMYQSSWTGPLQVHQFMNNVANQLLTALKSVRTVRAYCVK
jgi:hypothetical protein